MLDRGSSSSAAAASQALRAAADAPEPHGRYLGTLRIHDVQRRRASDAAAAQRSRDALRASSRVREFTRRLVQTLRLMVGVHDYDQYLAHMRLRHPEVEPLTREAFFRRCVDARYSGGTRSGNAAGGRCPC